MRAQIAALLVPLSSVITPFEGDAVNLNNGFKKVENYGVMSGKQGNEIPMLAYIIMVKGSVGVIVRCI